MFRRPLRLAIFSDSALPILNGVSVSIDVLIKALRSEGHSVHLFTAAHFRHKDSDPNTFRFPALQTPWTRGYPVAIPPFYPALHHFRRVPFDLIHAHTPFTIGFVGLRWAQSHGIPTVGTYHTLYDKYAHYIPFFPKRYVRYKIAKHTNFYYNSVDEVIVPSEAARKWLLRHSVSRPIHVIPTSVASHPPGERHELRMQLGARVDQRVLLYVGRIGKEKNMATLISGAAHVMKEDFRCVLWLVGDGPARLQSVQMARELGIGDRVRFFGFVRREEVDKFYAAADMFVFSSMTETQGLVVTEAMAYGLPAVVVKGGGASAAVSPGETGLIVRNDPLEMAAAIRMLLADDELYAQMSGAASRGARGYSAAEMAKRVLEVYSHCLPELAEPKLVLR